MLSVVQPTVPDQWLESLHIVLVEDQDELRQTLTTLLERKGAVVRAFSAAEDAQADLGREECDLVLSDVCMEGMGGPGLFDWVQTERADLLPRLVFMTGTPTEGVCAFMRTAQRPWIAKPFTPSELLMFLRDVHAEQ